MAPLLEGVAQRPSSKRTLAPYCSKQQDCTESRNKYHQPHSRLIYYFKHGITSFLAKIWKESLSLSMSGIIAYLLIFINSRSINWQLDTEAK